MEPFERATIANRYIVEHLEKQGYEVTKSQPGASGVCLVEAAQVGKKYLFAIKTLAQTDKVVPAPEDERISHEQRKVILKRAANAGAVAMLGFVVVPENAEAQMEMKEPIRFKRL